jgi:hypothetical protein
LRFTVPVRRGRSNRTRRTITPTGIYPLPGTPGSPYPSLPPRMRREERIGPGPGDPCYSIYHKKLLEDFLNDCFLKNPALPACLHQGTTDDFFSMSTILRDYLDKLQADGTIDSGFDITLVDCRTLSHFNKPNKLRPELPSNPFFNSPCGRGEGKSVHCKILIQTAAMRWVTSKEIVSFFKCKCCSRENPSSPPGINVHNPHLAGGSRPWETGNPVDLDPDW